MAGAEAENGVSGPMAGVNRGLSKEADALGQAPILGVGAPAREVVLIEVDADAGRAACRLEQAKHDFAPAATDVEHGRRVGSGRESANHLRGAILGERAVEGELGHPRRPGGVLHAAERYGGWRSGPSNGARERDDVGPCDVRYLRCARLSSWSGLDGDGDEIGDGVRGDPGGVDGLESELAVAGGVDERVMDVARPCGETRPSLVVGTVEQ